MSSVLIYNVENNKSKGKTFDWYCSLNPPAGGRGADTRFRHKLLQRAPKTWHVQTDCTRLKQHCGRVMGRLGVLGKMMG